MIYKTTLTANYFEGKVTKHFPLPYLFSANEKQGLVEWYENKIKYGTYLTLPNKIKNKFTFPFTLL